MLNDLAPNGFWYGGHYVVEFDPHSLWYETSLTIAAMALRKGMKTEYHVFQHFPDEAIEGFSQLGIDARGLEKTGLLSILDSYTETTEFEARKEDRAAETTTGKPLDLRKSAAKWTERAKAGYPEEQKRWLHIDDNTAIFLQYNDEKTFIDTWRTAILPYGIRAREAPHFLAFTKGVASDEFYTKFEALCDGIIDFKAREENDRIEHYARIRMLRGKTFDSQWHHLRLLTNGEVRLDLENARERKKEIGLPGWLKGPKTK